MKHYWESLFNENLTFILGWEAFVFLITLMWLLDRYDMRKIKKDINIIAKIIGSKEHK
tara:strand:+ start:313 stop:486 length:174 start_codon:yes stop_codon:yes gene_type:complete